MISGLDNIEMNRRKFIQLFSYIPLIPYTPIQQWYSGINFSLILRYCRGELQRGDHLKAQVEWGKLISKCLEGLGHTSQNVKLRSFKYDGRPYVIDRGNGYVPRNLRLETKVDVINASKDIARQITRHGNVRYFIHRVDCGKTNCLCYFTFIRK